VGEWKAAAVGDGEFGEEGVVEGKHIFTEVLGGKFIMGAHESWEGERYVHDSIDFMYYDPGSDRFLRKSAFSYGFVNNEVEYYRNERVIRFDVVMARGRPGGRRLRELRGHRAEAGLVLVPLSKTESLSLPRPNCARIIQ
jgi:hypothetical protein